MPASVVGLRFAAPADQPFLESLFFATRSADFVGLDEPTVGNLMAMQFRAQQQGYTELYGLGGDHIITSGDDLVGRLWVHCDGPEWLLVDIAVLPEYQRNGIGTVLIHDLVTQAEANGATVRLQVRVGNLPALRLYFRLGFTVESATDTQLQMVVRSPSQKLARFDQIRRVVLSDDTLQARLREYDRDDIAQATVDLAAELSIDLDLADVAEATRAARSEWLLRWV
jgi:GNAT superfamily N-acetyltransferase